MNMTGINLYLPKKFQHALKKKAEQDGVKHKSKRNVARSIIMRDLIKCGLVKPSKIDRQMCGLEN